MQALQPTLKSNPNAKPMIQSHYKLFIKSPVLIGNIKKAQFSLAKSKSLVLTSDKNKNKNKNSFLTSNIKKTQFSLVTSKNLVLTGKKKFNSHQQYQESSILIGNIKKTQFSLAISKTQFTLALFYQNPKIINTWQKYYVVIISLKSPMTNNVSIS